ncbi:hypothetical protein TCAL_09853, partial [Tigriopus californicus]
AHRPPLLSSGCGVFSLDLSSKIVSLICLCEEILWIGLFVTDLSRGVGDSVNEDDPWIWLGLIILLAPGIFLTDFLLIYGTIKKAQNLIFPWVVKECSTTLLLVVFAIQESRKCFIHSSSQGSSSDICGLSPVHDAVYMFLIVINLHLRIFSIFVVLSRMCELKISQEKKIYKIQINPKNSSSVSISKY